MNQGRFSKEAKEIVKLLPPQLITPTVFFWTFPLSIFLPPFNNFDSITGMKDLAIWSLIGFISHAAMYPFVAAGKNGRTLPEQIIFVLCMGFIRGAVIVIFARVFDVYDSLSMTARIVNATIAVFYWHLIGSVIVEYRENFRKRIKENLNDILQINIQEMPIMIKESSLALISVISQLQDKIVKVLLAKPTHEEIGQASKEIDNLIRDHIRPISQSHWHGSQMTWQKIGIFSVIDKTMRSQKIPVRGVVIFSLPFGLVGQINRIGAISALVVLSVWIVMVLLVDKIAYRESTLTNIYVLNCRFLIALIFTAYPSAFLVENLVVGANSSSIWFHLSEYLLSILTQILLFFLGCLLLSLHSNQKSVLVFFDDVIEKNQSDRLLANTLSGYVDRDFAQYVHAEVQSQLLACKILLLKAAESNFQFFPPEITKQLIARMETIRQPYQRPAARIPAQRMIDLSRSWTGLADISFEFTDSLYQLHPESDVISQLIEEAVVNAIRHGGAGKISISSREVTDEIEITVSDNGSSLARSTSPGLGSILFDTFTKSWSRKREGDATVVRFTVELKNEGATT